MRLVVNGIEVDVDDRHVRNPLMWVFRYVFGPSTSTGTGDELGGGESPRRGGDSLPPAGPAGDNRRQPDSNAPAC